MDRANMPRPKSSRGRHDRGNQNGSRSNNRRRTQDDSMDFEDDRQPTHQSSRHERKKSPLNGMNPLQFTKSEYAHEALVAPAVKSIYERNGRKKGQKVASPLERAQILQGGPSSSMSDKIPRKVRYREKEPPSNPSLGQTLIQGFKTIFTGRKRSSDDSSTSNTSNNSKRHRRNVKTDSLANVPQTRNKLKQQNGAHKKATEVIDLADSDSNTEDESTAQNQLKRNRSKRKSDLFAEVGSKKQAAKPVTEKPTTGIYGLLGHVTQEVKEAVPDTPSDDDGVKAQSPTKHALHSDVDSSSSSDDDKTKSPDEPDTVRRKSLQEQQLERERQGLKDVIRNNLYQTSDVDEAGGNQTEGDSDSEENFSFLPKGSVRKSKPAARLQVAQHAAKTRKNTDMEDINNFHQKKKKASRKDAAGTQPIVLDVDDDENDGTNANTKSKYFENNEPSGHPKVLPHPGMNYPDIQHPDMQYHDMQLYNANEPGPKTPSDTALPADLAVGKDTSTDAIMADFDQKVGQWKNGATPKSSSSQADGEDEDKFWGDIAAKRQSKSTNEESYSPEDAKASRRARKIAQVDDVAIDTDFEITPTRKMSKDRILQNALRKVGMDPSSLTLQITKVNGAKPNARKGKRVIPGASTATEARSQETTSSQESREFCARTSGRNSGRISTRYGTRSHSSQEREDYILAQQMQQQDDMLEASRRRNQGRTLKKKKKPATNEDEPIVLSSDSEEEDHEELHDMEYDLCRIALGKKVSGNGCRLTFSRRNNQLILFFKRPGRRGRNSNYGVEEISFQLNRETVKEFKCYEKKERDDDEPSAHSVDFNFVAIRAIPCEGSKNLDKHLNKYKPESEDAPKKERFIILEFPVDADFDHFRTKMEDHLAEICHLDRIDKEEALSFAEALVDDSQRMATSRIAIETQSSFLQGRGPENVLLVYPFTGDPTEIEAAADGLHEPSGKLKINRGYSSDESDNESDQEEASKMHISNTPSGDLVDMKEDTVSKVKVRQHYVTLRVKDYERLQPEEWLNDSLVDFWMQWIARSEDKSNTNLHFFTSHFYSSLAGGGPEAVTSWTAKKNINIFEKKFIFIPINKDLHWSLCAVVNPGCISNSYEADLDKKAKLDVPCLIFMDSLRMHRKVAIRKKIENWLNSEWERINPDADNTKPFTKDKFQLFTPAVPMQNNTWDCGVFVCRYALAIFKLRNRSFTFRDVHGDSPFSRLVAGGAEFDFNMKDIVRFRGEFQTLIENLSGVYSRWKREGEKPNPKSDDAEKSGGQEVETHEDKSSDQEMTDATKNADQVTDLVPSEQKATSSPPSGSPEDESMDLVNENESTSVAIEANSPPDSEDVVIENESGSVIIEATLPHDSEGLVNENESDFIATEHYAPPDSHNEVFADI
ncbi:unnamed protein product [Cylindrotheca closterium]|uniref:Ubiquitin-like protease family profile domain-containing protein n=1 Tax=Cylindrotheca closterium TaxID=2856 RepID=A0AAD2FL16_9STRA|nr:unnamed protein product [Cylindrotheca closterium]